MDLSLGRVRSRCAPATVVAAAAALLALGTPPAGASVGLGETFDPNATCGPTGGVTYVQRQSPGDSYVAPSAGVITSWSYHVGSTPPTLLKLKILTPAPGPGLFAYTVVAESAPQTSFAPSAVNSFSTRLPVSAGDRLGFFVNRPSTASCPLRAASGYETTFVVSDPPPGSTLGYAAPIGNQLNIAAVLEPDCDADGFGDETQDTDLTSCDANPPETTITVGPKDKTKKKTAAFEFSGTDAKAVAGFQCSLDGGAFSACTSPHTVKVKKGKHTFSVRAIDQAGNVDGSPATDGWKVKKKKKKKKKK